MTDRAYRYTQSKHARRLKSRQKRCHKQKAVTSAIKGSNALSQRSKASRAAQRKHWAKYNKKSKPRNVEQFDSFEAAQFLFDSDQDGYDSPFSNYSSSSSSNSSMASSFPYSNLAASLFLQFGRLAVSPRGVHKSPVVEIQFKLQALALFSRQFNSYDATYLPLPFAMDTFEGECRFWHHIMAQLGVLDELYAALYLHKCHRDHGQRDGYHVYADYVNAIAAKMLSTAHLLYILDHVEAECRCDFDVDFAHHAKKVVRDRDDLVLLIDASNAWHIGRDVAALIAELTMRSDDILARFHSRDSHRIDDHIETKEYSIDGHPVTDIFCNWELKAKIFDAKDITAAYLLCDKTFEESEPLFHCGDKRHTVECLIIFLFLI